MYIYTLTRSEGGRAILPTAHVYTLGTEIICLFSMLCAAAQNYLTGETLRRRGRENWCCCCCCWRWCIYISTYILLPSARARDCASITCAWAGNSFYSVEGLTCHTPREPMYILTFRSGSRASFLARKNHRFYAHILWPTRYSSSVRLYYLLALAVKIYIRYI